MAWHDTTLGAHYWLGGSGNAEAIDNAWEIYAYFRNLPTPWTIESIAALTGNIQYEGIMNPYVRDANTTRAFGLVQWITHRSDMISWARNNGMDPTKGPPQVQYIELERQGIDDQWIGRGDFRGMSMSDFAYNTRSLTVERLARCWWDCFERSAEYQTGRGTYAVKYYELFTGGTPPGPGPSPSPGYLTLWMLKRRWWYKGGRRYL